jgi:hypothetical protein
MKPFNLEKALAGEPVVTRDGRKIKDLHFFHTLTRDCKLYGVINNSVMAWTNEGHWLSTGQEQPEDLFMEEPEKWVNVYYSKVQDEVWASDFYESEEKAKECILSTSHYQTTIKINL